jgi:DNA-binding NarL/FixJ family response regulator
MENVDQFTPIQRAIAELIVEGLKHPKISECIRAYQPVQLTRAERRIAELILQGLKGVQIAEALGCSPRTIKQHYSQLYRKFNVDSTDWGYKVIRLAILLHERRGRARPEMLFVQRSGRMESEPMAHTQRASGSYSQ